ncbi:MAG: DHA2 family efflux MFS transporter permease subunit [Rhodospirillaceae bacterium]|nr:DHA2 family efflux MFS transporter permease subunit [Rhodospirillaceae bacterium]
MSGAAVAPQSVSPKAITLKTKRLLASVSIVTATIMQTLDSTIANVALPHMQGTMNAAQDQISWVLTSYVVATAICTPLTGYLERRLGRRRLFMAAIVGFTLASLLCASATSLAELVLFRLMQGAAGACIIPLSQAVLIDLFPPQERGPAMALWGVGVMIGPILGPTLGGYLTDVYSWRWVFLINVPLGTMATLGVIAFLEDANAEANAKFDIFGFTMLSVAMGCLQLMLDRGQTLDWFSSPEIILELALALAALWVFVVHMFTASDPFVSPQPFSDVNFVMGLVVIFFLGVVLLATMALLPVFLQSLLGYPVQLAGLILAPRGLGTMTAMALVGVLVKRFDARFLVGWGVALMVFSLWQMSQFTLETGMTPIIVSGVIQGLGMGFVFVPLSIVTFYTLPARHRTEGAAVYSLMRNIGSSIGVSLVTTFLSRATQTNHAILVEHVTPFAMGVQASRATGPGGFDVMTALPMLNGEITRQAAMLAYTEDFRFMMMLTIITVPFLIFLRPVK